MERQSTELKNSTILIIGAVVTMFICLWLIQKLYAYMTSPALFYGIAFGFMMFLCIFLISKLSIDCKSDIK